MDATSYSKELQQEIISLVESKYGELGTDIGRDVKHFLDQSEEKLIRWTALLENKKISSDEFGLLVYSQKDLLVMDGLHKAGVSKMALSRLRNAAIALVIKKAYEAL